MPAESPDAVRLLDLPGVRELEALETNSSGKWLTETELHAERDRISLSLFGITEADTHRTARDWMDLHPQGPITPDSREKAKAQAAAEQEDAEAWEDRFEMLYYEENDTVELWLLLGVDVRDDRGNELRCFEHLERQLFAAKGKMLPQARFTPDGSGRGASQDVESWGAALEEHAKRFKPGRK